MWKLACFPIVWKKEDDKVGCMHLGSFRGWCSSGWSICRGERVDSHTFLPGGFSLCRKTRNTHLTDHLSSRFRPHARCRRIRWTPPWRGSVAVRMAPVARRGRCEMGTRWLVWLGASAARWSTWGAGRSLVHARRGALQGLRKGPLATVVGRRIGESVAFGRWSCGYEAYSTRRNTCNHTVA